MKKSILEALSARLPLFLSARELANFALVSKEARELSLAVLEKDFDIKNTVAVSTDRNCAYLAIVYLLVKYKKTGQHKLLYYKMRYSDSDRNLIEMTTPEEIPLGTGWQPEEQMSLFNNNKLLVIFKDHDNRKHILIIGINKHTKPELIHVLQFSEYNFPLEITSSKESTMVVTDKGLFVKGNNDNGIIGNSCKDYIKYFSPITLEALKGFQVTSTAMTDKKSAILAVDAEGTAIFILGEPGTENINHKTLLPGYKGEQVFLGKKHVLLLARNDKNDSLQLFGFGDNSQRQLGFMHYHKYTKPEKINFPDGKTPVLVYVWKCYSAVIVKDRSNQYSIYIFGSNNSPRQIPLPSGIAPTSFNYNELSKLCPTILFKDEQSKKNGFLFLNMLEGEIVTTTKRNISPSCYKIFETYYPANKDLTQKIITNRKRKPSCHIEKARDRDRVKLSSIR